MISEFGCSASHSESLTWRLGISVSAFPLAGPAIASPFAWRHQRPVVLSSNIALK